jgi:hypothetical protein
MVGRAITSITFYVIEIPLANRGGFFFENSILLQVGKTNSIYGSSPFCFLKKLNLSVKGLQKPPSATAIQAL